ncbi:MAG: phosphohistidine phosphatase SixA [Nitrososphaerales archaeon]|jgi:phosphohistidine phosphatase
MDLIILRHGEAGKSMAAAARDAERSLTVAGREEVERVAQGLDSLGVKLDYAVTSPLKRARETATIATRVLKKESLLEAWDELSPEAETAALYRRLSKLKQDSTVLLVGHEPYLSGMLGELTAGTKGARIALKKAGAAKVEVGSFGPRPSGELRWLMTPRQLKKLA